jgi:hypothetical protein
MISDDTLTLYFYDDGLTSEEKREVEAALGADPLLAARYALLCRQFEQWREQDTTRAPEHLHRRWHDSIEEAARAEAAQARKPARSFHLLSFAWGGAAMAALALGVGLYFSGNNAVDPQIQESVAGVPRARADAVPVSFTRGLRAHLRDSQAGLASLPVENRNNTNQLLMQIIEQNRMFERSAQANNSADVARLLRALEPILLRLASDNIPLEDFAALRSQLAFELNVMLTKLGRTPSNHKRTI